MSPKKREPKEEEKIPSSLVTDLCIVPVSQTEEDLKPDAMIIVHHHTELSESVCSLKPTLKEIALHHNFCNNKEIPEQKTNDIKESFQPSHSQ